MALLDVKIFCIWQDQPARCQETNTLGGNSNNHAIFGTSCYVTQLRIPIPACSACRAGTCRYLDVGDFCQAFRPTCTLCTNWRFPDDPTIGLYKSQISDHFPKDAVVGNAFNRGDGTIDFTILIQAWPEACLAITTGRWTDTTAGIYLKTLCVNEATIKAMIHQC
jgi:hypothetical protein